MKWTSWKKILIILQQGNKTKIELLWLLIFTLEQILNYPIINCDDCSNYHSLCIVLTSVETYPQVGSHQSHKSQLVIEQVIEYLLANELMFWIHPFFLSSFLFAFLCFHISAFGFQTSCEPENQANHLTSFCEHWLLVIWLAG